MKLFVALASIFLGVASLLFSSEMIDSTLAFVEPIIESVRNQQANDVVISSIGHAMHWHVMFVASAIKFVIGFFQPMIAMLLIVLGCAGLTFLYMNRGRNAAKVG